MKLFRFRRPSINTLLGITKAKKWLKKKRNHQLLKPLVGRPFGISTG